jgi:hypothetical protein
MKGSVMNDTRVEVIFKKGRPVAAFFHFRPEASGKSGRQIHVRPSITAHFDAAGHSVGLEILLPAKLVLGEVNEILRELGASPVTDADLAPLRMI